MVQNVHVRPCICGKTALLFFPEFDNSFLTQEFTEEEVWKVVKELPRNLAPGPDGFSSFFYKEFWG